MKVAGYARVSSSGQKDQPLDQQIARLQNAGATEIISEVESGRKDDRAKYQKLLDKIKAGIYDGAIFTRIDRLGRNAHEILNSVEIFKNSGAYIKVLDQQIDTTDPKQDYFLITLYAGLAQQESDRLSERVRHGWNYTRQLKKAINPPFGYKVVNNKYLFDTEPFICLLDNPPKGWKEDDPPIDGLSKYDIAADAIEIFKSKRSLNSTVREINLKYLYANWQRGRSSKLMNEVKDFDVEEDQGRLPKRSRHALGWSVTGLKKWLLNPVLQGNTRYTVREKGKEPVEVLYPNTHSDVLVDLELLSKIYFYLENNERILNYNPEKQVDRHYLSGVLKCAECKCSCYLVRKDDGEGRNAKYFQCHKARMKECSNNKYVRIGDIEAELYRIIADSQVGMRENLIRAQEEAAEKVKAEENNLAYLLNAPMQNVSIQNAIADCRKRIEALKRGLEANIPDPFSNEKLQQLMEVSRLLPNEEPSPLIIDYLKQSVKFIWVNNGKIVKVTSR